MALPLATVDHTLFYVLGITLVVSAVALSAIGLKFEKFPPSRAVMFGVLAYFVALVAATVTFAVRNAQQEQADREAEQASATQSTTTTGETTTSATSTSSAPAGGGSTIKVSAD